MKDKIIEEAIFLLKEQGLKFNINDITSKLKISKKTIYKYFPSKDELALAMYEKLFKEFKENIVLEVTLEGKFKVLYKALLYLKDEIFNRFSLNRQIYYFANIKKEELWENITDYLNSDRCLEFNRDILKEIVVSSLTNIEYDKIDEYCLILKRGILK